MYLRKQQKVGFRDGTPVEYATQIEQVYVQGRKSDMMDMHRQLYEKYREKVEQAQAGN